jgi:hypothetical protein
MLRLAAGLLILALLAGCATRSKTSAEQQPADGQDWHAVLLPGKEATTYAWTEKDGRKALSAKSERSASMWRRKMAVPGAQLGEVRFSWWVDDLIEGAKLGEADFDDAPARVMFAFGGDVARLPPRTRMMFELAEALTGEPPPYATLMYVWESSVPVGTVIINPRTDRVRKIVVDSGPAHLRGWRDHRRDVAADFRLAFGEDPGPLVSMGVMTDSDNTRSRAQAWYGPVTVD